MNTNHPENIVLVGNSLKSPQKKKGKRKRKPRKRGNKMKQIQAMQNCVNNVKINEDKSNNVQTVWSSEKTNEKCNVNDGIAAENSIQMDQTNQETQETSQNTENPINWDFSSDQVRLVESLSWLHNYNTRILKPALNEFIQFGPRKSAPIDAHNFYDKTKYVELQKAKDIFNEYDSTTIYEARNRANPFEQIGSAFFMNRAAVKMANIDSVTGFLFTKLDENTNYKGPFYFADLCSGPGGFSEYILWRRNLFFKGFGITLKNDNDFKLNESRCASQSNFRKLYGKAGDGNICNPDNITDFTKNVLFETDSKGVHFVMADGGFSVEGREEHQEILSKNLYICQCLVALEVLRENGHFVTKLFDTFTNFSVGLLYLMYNCFEKVTILKPNTSRPANAERYFICYNRKPESQIIFIRQYLLFVVNKLWRCDQDVEDVLEIVPFQLISDGYFSKYIYNINNRLAVQQIRALNKIRTFCQNKELIDPNQGKIELKCLDIWKLPITYINKYTLFNPKQMVESMSSILQMDSRVLNQNTDFDVTFSDLNDWCYCTMYCNRQKFSCAFYVCTAPNAVFKYQSKWRKMKKVFLTPGTIVYGELVVDRSSIDGRVVKTPRIHIVDALRLGDLILTDMPFVQRMELIDIYCKSLATHLRHNQIYLRPKRINKLSTFLTQPLVKIVSNMGKSEYLTYFLKPLTIDSNDDYYPVASILFLKTNECMNVYNYQSFESTFILRVKLDLQNASGWKDLMFNPFCQFIKNKLSMP